MRRLLVSVSLTSSLVLGACGVAPTADQSAAPAAPGPRLQRSLFSKDPTGSLAEDDLQRVLDAQLDLTFPARVGVVSLASAFDPERGASVTEQAVVSRAITSVVEGSPHFSVATDVSTSLPNPSGIEGLRTIAARYRTRFLLLCNVVAEDRSHLNNWAWFYITGVGMLLAPGQTVATQGLVQASLLDVKTGTVLFTAMEPFDSSSATWLIGSGREQSEVDGKAIAKAGERLGKKLLTQTEHLVRWVEEERAHRVAAAGQGPSSPGPEPVP
jgi:rhombotail lipoprotein